MATLSPQDLVVLDEKGISEEKFQQQIANYMHGFPYVVIEKPSVIGDGIIRMTTVELSEYVDYFEAYSHQYKVIKFVPASGAASRMFKSLQAFMISSEAVFPEDVALFFKNLSLFAFYPSLKQVISENGEDIDLLLQAEEYKKVLQYLLTPMGLDYLHKPKALLAFHRSGDNIRMCFEEHLVEGALYCADSEGVVRLHYTVSQEHLADFIAAVEAVQKEYEQAYGVNYEISCSVQKPATDIVAVTVDNEVLRDERGVMVFRPGGHGALIENMNDLDADIIFVQNIDNVAPQGKNKSSIMYKKALGGFLLHLKNQIDDYLELLDEGSATEEELEQMRQFVEETLLLEIDKSPFSEMDFVEKIDMLYNIFHRPIRVCGMVKNEGEPGGGPFWIREQTGKLSMQIVESAQINLADKGQLEKVQKSTHFNPVDLVCAITDLYGDAFDLLDYVDPQTGFISEKTQNAITIKAQELPGLWNGAMADWLTLFVEIPIETFTPVKTVNDLLRPQHQE